jgi:hypothetical protein
VDAVPENSAVLTSVIAGLETTGVVSGEFGFVAAYQSKKATIEPWLSDTRERVRSFAIRYMLELDRLIASEQRRGEEDLEMRKRDFG